MCTSRNCGVCENFIEVSKRLAGNICVTMLYRMETNNSLRRKNPNNTGYFFLAVPVSEVAKKSEL